ncbi:hypothetical protein J14TS2_26400 [Bacillus sp. J14TS2]|uniref:hypothetical protein n=1 Tax=Bacillus sp. J14TS2 TaxID=2807188 RepID=UPI001B0A4A11|nr:hypothetical protein [Bacillus sp. J14TS2]GIN72165.1 hypothetical protein J14TS2_26400 [Bacillus sp. J14TS2]
MNTKPINIKNEHLLILLESELYNPSTIVRGAQLAKAMGCRFVVYYGLEEQEEATLSEQTAFNIAEATLLSLHYGAIDLIVGSISSECKFKQKVKTFQEEFQISQVVIRGFEESWLFKIMYGSVVNYFVKNFPEIDLHLVSKRYHFPIEDWKYEKGEISYLYKDESGYYLDEQSENAITGFFFKEKNAQSHESGVFIQVQGESVRTYMIDDLRSDKA